MLIPKAQNWTRGLDVLDWYAVSRGLDVLDSHKVSRGLDVLDRHAVSRGLDVLDRHAVSHGLDVLDWHAVLICYTGNVPFNKGWINSEVTDHISYLQFTKIRKDSYRYAGKCRSSPLFWPD